MKTTITTALAAILLAGAASASSPAAGAFSASGLASFGQRGEWSAGAMTTSYGGVSIRTTCGKCGGTEVNTWSGSTSEGFGSNFRGTVATGGAGFGTFGRR